MGLASLLVVGALQGCSEEDSGGSSGSAGSGTAGSGTAGSGTAGSGTAGSGTAGSGTAGSGGETKYCGKTADELPPISKCDDANASECAKAMCAVTGGDKDCKQILTDCEADPGCNKSVACGGVCRDPNNPEGTTETVAVCGPLAGSGITKGLAYKGCADKLTACGGDGSLDPK
ncbi:MAG: hypothetical protein MUF64_19210 [Polyangiaceae bacterium]|nr:hypothetical protein [Polyangiaceae bacterium]